MSRLALIRRVSASEEAHWLWGLAWHDYSGPWCYVAPMPFCFIIRFVVWVYWLFYSRLFRHPELQLLRAHKRQHEIERREHAMTLRSYEKAVLVVQDLTGWARDEARAKIDKYEDAAQGDGR